MADGMGFPAGQRILRYRQAIEAKQAETDTTNSLQIQRNLNSLTKRFEG
jgi:hypothetical protein